MKIVSFNVNGIRSRLHQLEKVIEKHQPDVIGLQETKVEDSQFPLEAVQALGYQAIYHGQKGHYGVALLYKGTVISSLTGFPDDDDSAQKRLVAITQDTDQGPVSIYNGYFPQGESRDHPEKFPNKRNFYNNLLNHLHAHHSSADNVIVMGDMNVAPLDKDIGIGEDNRKRWLRSGKCCFLPEERGWLNQLTDWGLIDTYEQANPENGEQRYSWFDYRSRGFEREPKRGLRIDLILATGSVMKNLIEAGIDQEIRGGEKPSDHCPVWVSLQV